MNYEAEELARYLAEWVVAAGKHPPVAMPGIAAGDLLALLDIDAEAREEARAVDDAIAAENYWHAGALVYASKHKDHPELITMSTLLAFVVDAPSPVPEGAVPVRIAVDVSPLLGGRLGSPGKRVLCAQLEEHATNKARGDRRTWVDAYAYLPEPDQVVLGLVEDPCDV